MLEYPELNKAYELHVKMDSVDEDGDGDKGNTMEVDEVKPQMINTQGNRQQRQKKLREQSRFESNR